MYVHVCRQSNVESGAKAIGIVDLLPYYCILKKGDLKYKEPSKTHRL